jgi:hypothetical protein
LHVFSDLRPESVILQDWWAIYDPVLAEKKQELCAKVLFFGENWIIDRPPILQDNAFRPKVRENGRKLRELSPEKKQELCAKAQEKKD